MQLNSVSFVSRLEIVDVGVDKIDAQKSYAPVLTPLASKDGCIYTITTMGKTLS